ncbi:MAG: DHA2 family multidrug resistance protein [Gammaproteobacteria bacterium]|jgi:DHA2 family multidrug resistance protein
MSVARSSPLRQFTLHQWLILATVQLATLLFGMTVTVANVVLPQIKGALSATSDEVAWVVTFNLVATAVATPMTGWLASRLGWRNLMVGALTGFVIASVACGFSNSLEMLVIARIAQGAFGAPLLPLGQGMILASFERQHHPLVLMIWGIGGVFGPVLGPVLGGIVAETLDWRWVFFMVVPFGIGAIVCAYVALGDQERDRSDRLDWIGFSSLAIAVGALQLVISRGQRLDWFSSPEIIIEAGVGAGALCVFLVHMFTGPRPLFSPALFADRNFVVGLFAVFVMGWLSYTPIVLFPPLLQELRGYPDSVVGYLMAGRGVGNWISFLIVVQFTRYNARLALAVGFAMQALAGFWMSQLNVNMTPTSVFWSNTLQGFGFGLAYTPLATLAFATLGMHQMTQGSGLFNLLRNFGSSLFISITIVVLVRTTAQSYDRLREVVSPLNERLALPNVAGGWSVDSPVGLASLAGEVNRQASMIGYVNAFYLFGIAAALGIPLAFMFRPPPKAGN